MAVALTLQSRVRLGNGTRIPVLGLGTWKLRPGRETEYVIQSAFEAGYRHIDTAKVYDNEESVGTAVRNSGLPRAEIWVTTKLWPTDQFNARQALERSLEGLGLDYVDLYLVHWPVPGLISHSWKAMERLFAEGLARSIGVSNYSISQIQQLQQIAEVTPMVSQVRFSPFAHDEDLLRFCVGQKIVTEAYSPLTEGLRLDDPGLAFVAKHYGKSPAQLLIRWALQKGTVAIPKSANPEHIQENAQVFDFEISEPDMDLLDGFSAPD
jgi:diketogulonate reductase-like aldo/keto reductase